MIARQDTGRTKGKKEILIVDDDPLLLDAMAQFLQRKGFAIITASNPQDALNHLNHQPDKQPDMIVTDFDMPGMNGMELADKLRQQGGTIPIILCSSHDKEQLKREGVDIDAVLKNEIIQGIAQKGAMQSLLKEIEGAFAGALPGITRLT